MQMINITDLLEKRFIGADDLRKQLTNILNGLAKNKEVVITQHGRPKGILLDIATYIKMQELADGLADYDPKFIKKMNRVLDDVKKHGGISADKVWEELGI